MSRDLPAAAKAELYAGNAGEEWVDLLTITHSGITTLRLVNDRQSVTSGGDVYSPFPFAPRRPQDTDEEPSAAVVIDAVDRSVIEAARSITTPATVTIETIRRSAPDTILESHELACPGATYDALTVSLDLRAPPVLVESYPGTDFTPLNFPAVFDR